MEIKVRIKTFDSDNKDNEEKIKKEVTKELVKIYLNRRKENEII